MIGFSWLRGYSAVWFLAWSVADLPTVPAILLFFGYTYWKQYWLQNFHTKDYSCSNREINDAIRSNVTYTTTLNLGSYSSIYLNALEKLHLHSQAPMVFITHSATRFIVSFVSHTRTFL
ncbi:uncharacterized protein [Pyrus communis]|uniref:uncharacterized protein isoform X2 n=1 Tax=Pyrus communis TaxID=23211 RepID=UPI0035BF5D28